jgi:ribosomal protein S18 acetylase RimI-like enzyme
MTIETIPATQFDLQELTNLYNQTRVDYLVPMPMNIDRLAEYIRDFDVALSQSCVVRESGGQVLGLGMLGVREKRAWVTRLGVLPALRRSGVGATLMDYMLARADALNLAETHLEVIKNNEPAYKLFLKKGFCDADIYLVMRRAPRSVSRPLVGDVKWFDREKALHMLQSYPHHLTWINAFESMENAANVEGMQITLPGGDSGWLVYRAQKFFLNHLVMHTVQGDPVDVGINLFLHLYTRYPRMDTYAENIHERDPHLLAFHSLSFFENFSRIEMRRKTNPDQSPG